MKERLTGAIILVALIVLLVPALLTGPVRSAPQATAVASSAEEPPLRSYTIKLADEPHARDAGAQGAPEQPAPLAAAPGTAVSSPPPAEEGVSAPAQPAPAPAPSNPAHPPSAAGTADTSGAYMVQLGSFASRANAERLAKQVHAQGFAVSVSQGSSGHRLYRVRVGPAHDRTAAGELAQQLRAHGHKGEVVAR